MLIAHPSLYSQGYLASLFGIASNPYSTMRSFFAFVSRLSANNSHEHLEILDTEIFATKVRIYRPVNRTDGGDVIRDDTLLPAAIYIHGGGWTLGSLGIISWWMSFRVLDRVEHDLELGLTSIMKSMHHCSAYGRWTTCIMYEGIMQRLWSTARILTHCCSNINIIL